MKEPIPVFMPPGFYGNGTPYAALGRFATGNLVRFRNGFVRPLGGWRRRRDQDGDVLAALWADSTAEAARNIVAWEDNAGVAHVAHGLPDLVRLLAQP